MQEDTTKYIWKPTQRLYLEPSAYEKMMNYVRMSKGEVSGFGKVATEKAPKMKYSTISTVYVVKDVTTFEQKCSYAGTKIDGEELSKFIVSLVKNKEKPEQWNLWWHSHNDFGVCWSGTDEDTITQLTTTFGSILFSICANKHLDMIARMDTKEALKTYDILIPRVKPNFNQKIYDRCKKEVKEKVKEYRPPKMKWEPITYLPREKSITYLDFDKLPIHEPFLPQNEILQMGLFFSKHSGKYMRLRDGEIFTEEEVKCGLHKAERAYKPKQAFYIPG